MTDRAEFYNAGYTAAVKACDQAASHDKRETEQEIYNRAHRAGYNSGWGEHLQLFGERIVNENAEKRKAFIRAFVIENSVALQDHDVLAIAVKRWDDIEEGA